jgi:molecular chaperone DnaK
MKMKTIAENYIGEPVTDAVITVPAYFNDAQREATKKAGVIAGLNVRRIVAEPTAAILASNIDMNKGGKYMVVDYGGSTLDFSIADISDGVVEIKASNGDVYCGGSDLDKIVSDYVVEEFKK